MNYHIDQNNRPIYLQIYRLIRDDIINGNYPYHTKLPSKRCLADNAAVSTVTVEHAYSLLCDEGYAEAKERSGYIVTFRANDGFATAATSKIPDVTLPHIHHSYPDFPFSVLAKTIRKILTEHSELLLIKPPNSGCYGLRDSIRKYLARNRGIYVNTEQIIIGSGSEYLYSLITELLGRTRKYAIESPSYQKIEQVYRATEVIYELLPLTQTGIESNSLSLSTASVLHVTPYRSFPSGVTASASKRYEYVNWASTNDRYIIEDDYESEFSLSSQPTETLFTLSNKHNVIYLNTFSKTISPSLRVSYMVIPQSLVNVFQEKLGFYSCTVPTLIQYTLCELINNGDFERHINRVRRKLKKKWGK